MIIRCPHCGESVQVNGIGRKPLNITVINVCDALQISPTVSRAAEKLNCSRGYIYKVLKEQGTNPKEVVGVKGKK